MEQLTFHINHDRRGIQGTLDSDVFNIDWADNKYQWIEARQYDSGMRQAIVKILTGDGSKSDPFIPMDLTGINPVLEGVLPDGKHRIFDSKSATMLDATGGEFRYDFPAQAFAVAGSYKQIFFRLMKNGQSVATLEFSMDVMADKVISGLIPSDYITPFNDLYSQLETIVKNAGGDLDKFKADWDAKLQELVSKYGKDFDSLQEIITRLQDRITDIAAQVKANNVVTLPMLSKYAGCPVMIGVAHLELGTGPDGFPDMYPSVHAYIGKYGAGLGGAGTTPAGGSAVYDVNVRAVRNEPTEIEIYVSPENITGFMQDFDMTDPDATFGGAFAYIYSGIYTLEVEFKGAKVVKFDVDSTFKTKFTDEKTSATTPAAGK
ncbi:phage baseplate upper protein [uncultured Limosilactobacillus sp.]|uniref:phage baseplate upper protein n=1 Tax=uncultured Limosilactobacillus sp. TaxID=2837629 RepID=UPI0025E12D9F|nr:phage baseplate upper protein [uncultured Limosilactobacillus sp.]